MKRSTKNIIIGIIALLFITYLINRCNKQYNISENSRFHLVHLEVSGDGGASITYINADGGTEQIDTRDLPWSKNFECSGRKYLYISAQAKNYNSDISVKIRVDGVDIKDAKSHGDFVIASVSTIIDQ